MLRKERKTKAAAGPLLDSQGELLTRDKESDRLLVAFPRLAQQIRCNQIANQHDTDMEGVMTANKSIRPLSDSFKRMCWHSLVKTMLQHWRSFGAIGNNI